MKGGNRMPRIARKLTDLIGNTPLLQLENYSAEAGLKIGRASCRERV
jgi:hypothetical protein